MTASHAGHEITPDGLYADRPGLISTRPCRLRVDPLDLQPADVNIRDIARALSRQCRYNGHVDGFLSVARHSVWVSTRCRHHGPLVGMCGLLHDATETYLGDMVRPLKHRPEMVAFRAADEKAERAIAQAFGLPWPWPDVVHEADQAVTQLELDVYRDSYDSTPQIDESAFLLTYSMLRTELGQ